MPSSVQSDSPLGTVAVVGVGLIGGSIAAAVKQRGIAQRVIGLGRNSERLAAARRAGLIDRGETEAAAISDADLIVVCTPVDRIAADVIALAAHAKSGALFTDAGSVKAAICRDLDGRLPPEVAFVGAHPLAGSEKAGFEHADANLFDGRVCVVTPDDSTPPAALTPVSGFWEALGLRVVEMPPQRHDEVLALTSHLPHAVAAALASLMSDDVADFASTGFRDTTRIAGGDPGLWAAILGANREPVVGQIDRIQQQLAALREAIVAEDVDRIASLLRDAQERRSRLG